MRMTFVLAALLLAGCVQSPHRPVQKQTAANVAPARPKPVEVNVPGKRLAWNANPEPDVIGYRVWYRVTPTGIRRALPTLITGTSTTVPQFMFPIYWVVVAYNTQGMPSPVSNEIIVPAY